MEQKQIQFASRHFNLAGVLNLPDHLDTTVQHPAIVVSHPSSSDKQQTSGLYAQKLAAQGFITLAFDAGYQGQSEGTPRYIEDPAVRTEDISFAIDYLVTLPYVDANRIGALGICAGGGYTINAAKTDRRIKAVATAAAANVGAVYREAFGPDATLLQTLEQIGQQRTAEAQGAEPMITQWIPNSAAELEQAGYQDRDYIEAVAYYRTPRGQDEFAPNQLRFTSLAQVLGFDAGHLVEKLLTQPLCLVVGEKPGAFGSYRFGWEIYDRAAATDKTLTVLPGVSHYDLYDQPAPVKQALAQFVPFFQAHL